MLTDPILSGAVASAAFLVFTGLGTLAQLLKLRHRAKLAHSSQLPSGEVCEGLNLTRELFAYLAFLFFALSGATRNYFDFFLVFSRLPILALTTWIIWYLFQYGTPRGRELFLLTLIGNALLLLLVSIRLLGLNLNLSLSAQASDLALIAIAALLLYGKLKQAHQMHKLNRSNAVSRTREFGILIKDFSGLWYAWSVGVELLWVALTHFFSIVGSFAILLVKWRQRLR